MQPDRETKIKIVAMLYARKNYFLNWLLYRLLIYNTVRRSFFAVHLRQPVPVPHPSAMPVILYGNHSSWWDAHVAMLLNEEVWHRDGYVMVEDTQLSRYQFFRYMGAFSVSRTNARVALESIKYAAERISTSPNSLLLIFPQGEIRANDQRPLGFYCGIAHIARKVTPCLAYPLALRYEFVGEQKPEAFLSVGPPIVVHERNTDIKSLTNSLELALTDELERLRIDILRREFNSFHVLVEGLWSINRVWDAVRGKKQIKRLGPH